MPALAPRWAKAFAVGHQCLLAESSIRTSTCRWSHATGTLTSQAGQQTQRRPCRDRQHSPTHTLPTLRTQTTNKTWWKIRKDWGAEGASSSELHTRRWTTWQLYLIGYQHTSFLVTKMKGRSKETPRCYPRVNLSPSPGGFGWQCKNQWPAQRPSGKSYTVRCLLFLKSPFIFCLFHIWFFKRETMAIATSKQQHWPGEEEGPLTLPESTSSSFRCFSNNRSPGALHSPARG